MSLWPQCLALNSNCAACAPFKVSIFWVETTKSDANNSIESRELFSHCESDHRAGIPLWQIFVCQEQLHSPTVILTRYSPQKCGGRKFSEGKKTKLKARTCEDQTQEYNSVNITRIRRALYGPAAPDWQAAWRLACRTEGGQVYSLAFLFICGVICLWLRSSEECL